MARESLTNIIWQEYNRLKSNLEYENLYRLYKKANLNSTLQPSNIDLDQQGCC